MKAWSKLIVVAVLVVGLVSVAAGGAFIGLGLEKNLFLKSAMEEEKITLGINDSQLAKGEVVDTMERGPDSRRHSAQPPPRDSSHLR